MHLPPCPPQRRQRAHLVVLVDEDREDKLARRILGIDVGENKAQVAVDALKAKAKAFLRGAGGE